MIIYISNYHIELCHGSNEGRLGESQYDTAKYQYSLAFKIKKIYNYICINKIHKPIECLRSCSRCKSVQ